MWQLNTASARFLLPLQVGEWDAPGYPGLVKDLFLGLAQTAVPELPMRENLQVLPYSFPVVYGQHRERSILGYLCSLGSIELPEFAVRSVVLAELLELVCSSTCGTGNVCLVSSHSGLELVDGSGSSLSE